VRRCICRRVVDGDNAVWQQESRRGVFSSQSPLTPATKSIRDAGIRMRLMSPSFQAATLAVLSLVRASHRATMMSQ
jgi:hypothetical protein